MNESLVMSYMVRACEVIERGAAVESLRSIYFVDGRLRAHNGVLEYQAPTGLPAEDRFALQEQKLAVALRSCGEQTELGMTKDFIRLKTGPLSVRVRKLPAESFTYDRIAVPKSVAQQHAAGLHDALLRIRDFISTDASRPFSVSVMIKGGYAHATNNLSLVRTPCALPDMRIPLPLVQFLCDWPEIEYWHIDDNGRLIFVFGRELVRAPQTAAPWPDIDPFFAKYPAEMPQVPETMLEAAKMIERFSERAIRLSPTSVESKSAAIEADYEIAFEKGAGLYSAKLLSLILAHATHADFSFYPQPVYFKGDQLEGVASGIKEGP